MIVDFNLDGKNDLAWKQGFTNDDVHIRLNGNTGGLLAVTDFDTEIILNSDLLNYGAISFGDINGDGKPDILALLIAVRLVYLKISMMAVPLQHLLLSVRTCI